MTHPGSDETRVFRASRFKWAVLFLAGAVFAMAGVLIFFAAPGGRVGGIVVFVFFGACAAVAATQLVLRSTLTLTTDGFTFTSLGRRVNRRWEDVDFLCWRGYIGAQRSGRHQARRFVRAVVRSSQGCEGHRGL